MLLDTLNIVAISAEAMTAALIANRYRMDWFGVAVIGAIAGLGGGTLRDVLLDHHPLTWVKDPWLLLLTTIFALIGSALAARMQKLRHVFLALDAMGLVVFTVGGCNVAYELHQPPSICVMAGMVTGCAGGVIRDVMCNVVPLLFQQELYASVSAVVACVYLYCFESQGMPQMSAVSLAMITGFLLRGLALRYNLRMPSFATGEPGR